MTQTYIYQVTQIISIKVIQIKDDEQKIIVKRTTATALENDKQIRVTRKPGEHKKETYNDVVVRRAKL